MNFCFYLNDTQSLLGRIQFAPLPGSESTPGESLIAEVYYQGAKGSPLDSFMMIADPHFKNDPTLRTRKVWSKMESRFIETKYYDTQSVSHLFCSDLSVTEFAPQAAIALYGKDGIRLGLRPVNWMDSATV